MGTHPIFESDFDCLTEMSDPIKLDAPPKTLSLDDSNFFNNRLEDYNKGYGKYKIPEENDQTELEEDLNASDISNLSLDKMSETDKLRTQMFKVNRRLAKLENENGQLRRNNKFAFLF